MSWAALRFRFAAGKTVAPIWHGTDWRNHQAYDGEKWIFYSNSKIRRKEGSGVAPLVVALVLGEGVSDIRSIGINILRSDSTNFM